VLAGIAFNRATMAGADGAALDTVTDLFTGATIATAAGAARPTLTATGADFDGVGNYLALTTLSGAVPQSFTFAAVVTPTVGAAIQTIYSPSYFSVSTRVSGASSVGLFDGAAWVPGMAALTARKQLLVWVFDATGSPTCSIYRDGRLLAVVPWDGTVTTPFATPTIGALNSRVAHFFDGEILFGAIIPSALSGADLATAHAVLMAEYGIAFSPLSLPISYWHTMREPYITVVSGAVTDVLDRSGNGRNAPISGAGDSIAVTPDALGIRHVGSGSKKLAVPTWGRVQPYWDIVDAIMSRSGIAPVSNRYTVDGSATNSGVLFVPSGTTNCSAYASAFLTLAGGVIALRKRTAIVYNGASSSIRQNNGTPTTGNAGATNPGGREYFKGSGGTPADGDVYHSIGGDYVPTAYEIAALDTWLATYGDAA